MPSKIEDIVCRTHETEKQSPKENHAVVTLRSRSSKARREFVLLIKVEKAHEPVSYVEVFDLQEKLSEKFEKEKSDTKMDYTVPSTGITDPDLAAFGPQPGMSFFSISDFPQPGGFIGFDTPLQSVPSTESTDNTPKTKTSDKPHAVVVSLHPSIDTDEDVISEIIFLIDRSGSMAG